LSRTILTCSPYFIEAALNELRRHHPQIAVVQQLAPGYVFLETPTPFDKLTVPWQQRLPIYLHHFAPVQTILPLQGSLDDLNQLRQSARAFIPPDAMVQVRSAVETELPYSLLDIQQVLNPRQPAYCPETPSGRILSIFIAPDHTGLNAYLGVSKAQHNLSAWAGGQFPVTEAVSNRAGFKLLEALQTFAIRLRQGNQALDLGAAPGAWTTLLRRRGLQVTAVAPSALYPWLLFDPDVRYKPMLAEAFLDQCATTFDLIVNDMKLSGQDSARLMVDYAQHLRSEGIAIMSLKLRDQNRQRIMDHTFRILRKAYKIIRVRQLISNRKEVTLFLRRKD
jgi:23S rRNA (cytidine2498-2'-O)-methyltransferase